MTTLYSNVITPAPLGGNRGVLAAARALHAASEPFVLAIVIATRGSTYRKPGALALVAQDGSQEGVISGGCLETTLQEAALAALTNDTAQVLVFDTQSKDDVIFGSGSACRGLMQVLLLPVNGQRANELYLAIEDAHKRHLSLKLALNLCGGHIGEGMAWSDDDSYRVGRSHAALVELREAAVGEHLLSSADGNMRAAVFEIKSPPRLLLIGAGPESAPLMRIGRSLGWFITLVDHRPAAVNAYSLHADHALIGRPSAALAQRSQETFDAALVMTHTAAADLEALQVLAGRSEPYIGLLGPPARRDELLAQLDNDQRSALQPRLHAPLGLRLGGDGPEPLALSIAAELQRFFTQA